MIRNVQENQEGVVLITQILGMLMLLTYYAKINNEETVSQLTKKRKKKNICLNKCNIKEQNSAIRS
jgi:hypothetical protein